MMHIMSHCKHRLQFTVGPAICLLQLLGFNHVSHPCNLFISTRPLINSWCVYQDVALARTKLSCCMYNIEQSPSRFLLPATGTVQKLPLELLLLITMTCPCMLIWLKEACGLVVSLMELHARRHGIALHRMSMQSVV